MQRSLHLALNRFRHRSNPIRRCAKTTVSVVIPTYNRAAFLAEALRSAVTQTRPAGEIVVVDDGSTEDISSVVESVGGGRARLVRKEHSGAPLTRNRGIAEARGEFICWLDSDDVLMPEALARHMEALAAVPKADVIYGDLVITDAALCPQREESFEDWHGRRGELIAAMARFNRVPNPGTLVRTSCYERGGLYDPAFVRAHDYEWWTRLLSWAEFKHSGATVALWRWHDGNMSAGSVQVDTRYEAMVLRRLLDRFDLRELYPDAGWAAGGGARAEAAAVLEVARRLLDLSDAAGALAYLQEGHARAPAPETRRLIGQLTARLEER